MTEPREDRITAEGVHKAFGDNEVLKGVSFTVPRGTSTAIIGPSGSGKTTLLRALNALDKPDAGVIRVGGADGVEVDFSKPVSNDQLRKYRAQSGFVFQSHNLFPHKTVLQNVTGPSVTFRSGRRRRPKPKQPSYWSRSGSPKSGISIRSSCRAASSSASALHGHWR